MPRRKRHSARFRVGRVSVYFHHGRWWIYFREGGKPVRRNAGSDRDEAERQAAQVNAKLTAGERSPYAFSPASVSQIRELFLENHKSVLNSSPATVNRYRTATKHLEDFVGDKSWQAHEVDAEAFASYLRRIEVAPNGHPKAQRRRLRHKGILFILETCRSL